MKHSITTEPTQCSSGLLDKHQFFSAVRVDVREPLRNIPHIEMSQRRIMQVGCIKMDVMKKRRKMNLGTTKAADRNSKLTSRQTNTRE